MSRSSCASVLLVGLGVGIGWAGAWLLTRFVSGFLYGVSPTGVSPTNPLTFMAVAVVLAPVMLAATYVPARRAAASDPTLAVRAD